MHKDNRNLPLSTDADLTEIRRQETLIKAGALQSAIFNSVNFSSIATDAQGVIQIFNVGAERMLGYTAAEVMNKITPAAISDPQELIARAKKLSLEFGTTIAPGFEALVFKAARGIEDIYELTKVRKDGSRFPAIVSVTALRDAQNGIIGYLLIGTDNTARKQYQEVAEEFFEQPMALHIVCKLNGEVVRANSAWSDILGYELDKFIGANILDFIHPDDKDKTIEELSSLGKGNQTLLFENRYRHQNGLYKTLNWSANASIENDAVYALAVDITERKRYEYEASNTSRALATLIEVNRLLVRATNELEFLSTLCQALVKQRGYRMAWVGYLEHDEAKTMRVVAKDGVEEGYLEEAHIVWSDTEHGRGPSGIAARSGETQVVQNFLTDDRILPWRAKAAQRGYAASICLPLILHEKVFGVLTIYSGHADAFNKAEVKLLEEMASDLAFGVGALRTRHERDTGLLQIKQQLVKLESNLEDTVEAISTIVELRDPYTAGHQQRVAELAVTIAREMGLPDEQIHGIRLGGIVHDLGKIQIPAEILAMPRRLNETEYKLVQFHPQAGYDILKDIDFPWPIAQMVLQHHERLDGSGYPWRLKGEAIILEARILCVADVVEAMASHRPYRPGLGVDSALDEIKRGNGTIYDPQVAAACLKVFAEGKFKL